MKKNFHIIKESIIQNRIPFTLEQLSNLIHNKKPTEIFNGEWSTTRPFIVITEYVNDGFLMYCNSLADKTPVKYDTIALYNFLKYQSIGDCYINVKSEEEAWCDTRDTMYNAWKEEQRSKNNK